MAVAWQIGAQIVSRYVVGGHYTAYGVVGSFIAMMLWVYCASILLFLGAQLVQVLGHPEENVVDPAFAVEQETEPVDASPARGIQFGADGANGSRGADGNPASRSSNIAQ